MPKPVKTYDLKAVYLTIGGYRIGGYGASGGVSMAYGADIATPTVGADGEAAVSRSNDNSMTATITVMETSKSYRDLATLQAAQMAQEAITRLEFSLEDEINGDKFSDQYAVFLNRPDVAKGKGVGERVFKVFLGSAAETAKFGSKISV